MVLGLKVANKCFSCKVAHGSAPSTVLPSCVYPQLICLICNVTVFLNSALSLRILLSHTKCFLLEFQPFVKLPVCSLYFQVNHIHYTFNTLNITFFSPFYRSMAFDAFCSLKTKNAIKTKRRSPQYNEKYQKWQLWMRVTFCWYVMLSINYLLKTYFAEPQQKKCCSLKLVHEHDCT